MGISISRTQRFVLAFTGLILLIPFIAMQFTDEVDWSTGDFLIAGVLLLGFGWIGERLTKRVDKRMSRILIWSAVLLVLLLIWAELAVGIF
ncbi:MAG: hypothetical protein HKN79_11330 [Flavobacteriales bacterium]|nr:hypothetical protein [Flavobacteriales bacterium]